MKFFKFFIVAIVLLFAISANAQTASFTLPSTAFVGEVVIADGTASSNVNGQVGWSTKTFSDNTSAVFWNFGDGLGTYSTPKQTLRAAHVYFTAGTYTVNLLVKNSAGVSNSISHNITISNIPAATGGNAVTLTDQGSNSANCTALQGAINTALANNTVEREILLPNISYPCQLNTSNTPAGSKYITIRPASSGFLPNPVDRINPTLHSANMPKIVSPGVDLIPLTIPIGSHHLRFVGIEFDKQAGHLYQFMEIGSGVTDYSQVPHHIIIDRCYFKGNAFDDTARAIFVNADSFSLINSYIRDMHDSGFDAQAIAGFTGVGIAIVNNYLNGLGENVLFGGADSGIKFQSTVSGTGTSTSATLVSVANLRVGDGISFTISGVRGPWTASIVRSISGNNITFDPITNSSGVATAPDTTLNAVRYGSSPQDIVISRNYLPKGLNYKVGDPSYSGYYSVVKNTFELKHAMRVIFDGNVIENHWGGQGQSGPTVLFTPRNQTCYSNCTGHSNPWATVRDITLTNNKVLNIPDFVNILGTDELNPTGTNESGPSGFVQYILVENNLVTTNAAGMNGGGAMVFVFPGAKNITVNHITQVDSGNGGYIIGSTAAPVGSTSENVKIMNSIFKYLTYGAIGDGHMGNDFVNTYFPDGNITFNAISDDFGNKAINGEAWTSPKTMPNDFPATINTNTFIDLVGGNYKLKSTSPYKAGGASPASDGTDKGVDFDVVSASTANSISGVWSGTPPVTTSSTIKIFTANVQHGEGTDSVTDFARQSAILSSSTIGADIVFMQERNTGISTVCSPCTDSAWNSTMTGFTEQIFRENGHGNDGPSIWTRNSTVTVLQTYHHALSTGAVGWDGVTNVDKAAVGIKASVNGKIAFFFNTHLAWSAGADCQGCQTSTIRVNQINELLTWINTVVGSDPNWLVGGDMNFSPTMPKSPSGFQIDLFTNAGTTSAKTLAIASGNFILNWGDRDANGIPDMLGSDPVTHDTREIDHFFLKNGATRIGFVSLEITDNRATCSTALTGSPKFCPDITDPNLRWGNSGDFGVRPSDHNWLLLTLTTDIAPPSAGNKKCNWHRNPQCEP